MFNVQDLKASQHQRDNELSVERRMPKNRIASEKSGKIATTTLLIPAVTQFYPDRGLGSESTPVLSPEDPKAKFENNCQNPEYEMRGFRERA